jgi:glycogen synthase
MTPEITGHDECTGTPSRPTSFIRPAGRPVIGAGETPLRRVLMTVDTVGGVWTYAIELAAALRATGVQFVLATMGAPLSPAQRADLKRLPHVALCESRYKLEWMDEPWEDVATAGEWLLDLEDTVRPDIVHINGYVHAALPFRAPTLAVGHSCVCSWFAAVHACEPPRQWNAYRRQVRRGLAAAGVVTAPTDAMLQALRRHYGAFRSTAAIPNARRPALFPPGVKQRLVLTVGRVWDAGKNIALVDSVALRLPWPVYVAGSAAHPDGGQVGCANLRMLGALSERELADWYARAAIFALPAKYEPFGLAALEAGLAQCALVLGDIPSLREVWADAALFVPPDDPNALAEAIEQLADDDALRLAYAARARARALTYTPARMGQGYLNVYQRLRRSMGAAARTTTVAGSPQATRMVPLSAAFRHPCAAPPLAMPGARAVWACERRRWGGLADSRA